MSNRLECLFAKKSGGLLSVYFTAGYPERDDTEKIILSLARHGADMIEVGVPFSDPMADGPVIQDSGTSALRNGMTMKLLFDQVESAREQCPDIPLVLMGYLNPMMQFGIERLFERCSSAGIDAVIIPDLPFGEYMEHFKPLCEKYGIPVVMLITPVFGHKITSRFRSSALCAFAPKNKNDRPRKTYRVKKGHKRNGKRN